MSPSSDHGHLTQLALLQDSLALLPSLIRENPTHNITKTQYKEWRSKFIGMLILLGGWGRVIGPARLRSKAIAFPCLNRRKIALEELAWALMYQTVDPSILEACGIRDMEESLEIPRAQGLWLAIARYFEDGIFEDNFEDNIVQDNVEGVQNDAIEQNGNDIRASPSAKADQILIVEPGWRGIPVEPEPIQYVQDNIESAQSDGVEHNGNDSHMIASPKTDQIRSGEPGWGGTAVEPAQIRSVEQVWDEESATRNDQYERDVAPKYPEIQGWGEEVAGQNKQYQRDAAPNYPDKQGRAEEFATQNKQYERDTAPKYSSRPGRSLGGVGSKELSAGKGKGVDRGPPTDSSSEVDVPTGQCRGSCVRCYGKYGKWGGRDRSLGDGSSY